MNIRTILRGGPAVTRSVKCLALLVLTGTAQCGGSSGGGGGSSTDGGGSSPAATFVGKFQATLSATGTIVSPSGVPQQTYADTAVITVTAQDAHNITMVWQVGSNPPSGTITFTTNGNSATASGLATGGACFMGALTNGNQQTTCATTATAQIDGDKLTQQQSGTVTGVTPQNVSYSGTYMGTWTGTRVQ
jgi:hypothetical protein